MNRRNLRHALGALLFLTPIASGGDHWIDPVSGSDINSGSSPSEAWRTMTHAMSALPPAVPGGTLETLILLPGTYSAASGELFPIDLRRNLRIVGEEGEQATIIEGISPPVIFKIPDAPTALQGGISLEGLTLQGGGVGIIIWSVDPLELRLQEMSFRENSAGLVQLAGFLDLQAKDVRFRDNFSAVELYASSHIRIEDSTFRNSLSTGLEISPGPGTSMDIEIVRSRFANNQTAIASSGAATSGVVNIEACLFEDNVEAVSQSATGTVDLHLLRSTLADNNAGIFVSSSSTAPILVQDSILARNGTNVAGNTTLIDMSTSWTSGAPKFVDPDSGDYRLAHGSPCVDQRPALPGALDQRGRARDVDGDGDLQRASDLGALELVTLSFGGSATLGETAEVELFSEPGGRSLVLFSRGLPTTVPFTNQYGELFLAPGSLRVLGLFADQPGRQPTPVPFSVPNQAAYLGQTFSLQAISSSSLAPAGGAYTTTTTFTVE